jgi:Zn-dependent protease
MGPLANILFLLVVVILFVVVNLLLVAIGSDFAAIPGKISFRTPFVLAAYVALPVLVWLFRRRICEFALLPVGFLMLALLAVWNFKFFQFHGMPFYGGSDFVGDIYAKAPKDVSMYASLWRGAITGMFLSTLMGVCNLIPLMPADGGHMMKSLLPHAWRNTFSYATVPVVALLLLFQYGKDLYNLGHWLYSIF